MDNQRKHEWSSSDWGWPGTRAWVWGILFILAGAILLLQELRPDLDLDILNAGNWWVILIFVPGINMIANGWAVFRRTGRVWGPLMWGILLVGFGLSQLLNGFGGQFIWPVLLILGGVTLLFGGRR